jgi:hypothetical protein
MSVPCPTHDSNHTRTHARHGLFIFLGRDAFNPPLQDAPGSRVLAAYLFIFLGGCMWQAAVRLSPVPLSVRARALQSWPAFLEAFAGRQPDR